MKHLLFLAFLQFISIYGFAQELTIKSFKENTKDLTASTSIRKDNNDEPCALVKVQLTATGAQFEPNVVGNIAYKVNEYWVYLPKGSKHLKVKHPNYLTKDVVFADYNVPFLQSKMTYELVIALPETSSTQSFVTSQYLIFKVNPTDALVEVGGDLWENNNGIARKFVSFGNYNYTVQAKDYHPISSSVSVLDPNNKVEVNVNLKPAFGKVTVKESPITNGANVYVDNKLIGKVPLTIDRISSGTHQIKIAKAMYKSYKATFTVDDGETTMITPNLEANFSVIRFTVDNEAEIWINDERKGVGEWKGNLEYGDYKVETRKAYHRSQSRVCTISSSADEQTFKLTAPTPIYGSLNIDIIPDGAKVLLDGNNVGETPLFLQHVLIGPHSLSIEKTGYNTAKQTITIGENKPQEVKASLQKIEGQLIKDGIYYIKSVLDPEYVLDVNLGESKTITNDYKVSPWKWHGGKNQQWRVENKNDYIFIHSVMDDKFVLDIATRDNNIVNGCTIQMWEAHTGNNQRWRVEKSGNAFILHSLVNDKYVMDAGTSNKNEIEGKRIHMWEGGDYPRMKWIFEKVNKF